jgi:hypothetical protein
MIANKEKLESATTQTTVAGDVDFLFIYFYSFL